jgi:RHS repeat-associated protein
VQVQSWWGGLVDGMRDGSGQMYMRNRYYDPATGQFTQPDPIGLAGGLNSYGFAAGDPVSYADPYGLKVCFQGSKSEVGELRAAAEGATGAAIHLDKQNCISSVGNPMVRSLRGLRDRLEFLRRHSETFNVGFTFTESDFHSACDNAGSHFCPIDLSVTIDQTDIGERLEAPSYFGCSIVGPFQTQPAGFGWGNPLAHSGETIIAHELLGHAWANATGVKERGESLAIRAENVFRTSGRGGRARCGG